MDIQEISIDARKAVFDPSFANVPASGFHSQLKRADTEDAFLRKCLDLISELRDMPMLPTSLNYHTLEKRALAQMQLATLEQRIHRVLSIPEAQREFAAVGSNA